MECLRRVTEYTYYPPPARWQNFQGMVDTEMLRYQCDFKNPQPKNKKPNSSKKLQTRNVRSHKRICSVGNKTNIMSSSSVHSSPNFLDPALGFQNYHFLNQPGRPWIWQVNTKPVNHTPGHDKWSAITDTWHDTPVVAVSILTSYIS